MKTLKLLLVPLALVAAWILGVQLLYPLWLASQPETGPTAPDFTGEAAWLVRPEPMPPAVWENDWAIDVFLIPPRPEAAAAPGQVDTRDAAVADGLIDQTEDLRSVLGGIGPVYVPSLRLPSSAQRGGDWRAAEDDVMAALDAYMERANRGRALIFAVPPSSMQLLPALEAAAAQQGGDVRQRFLGVVTVGSPVEVGVPSALCNHSVSPDCNLVVEAEPAGSLFSLFAPRRPGAPAPFALPAPDSTARRLTVFANDAVDALALGADKMVEPFGMIEVIEPNEIRRPGEVDEDDQPN